MLAFAISGSFELLFILIIGLIVLVPAAVAVVALVIVFSRSRNRSADDPNLTPCPDCGRLVSLRAATCPQCGCPLQTQP